MMCVACAVCCVLCVLRDVCGVLWLDCNSLVYTYIDQCCHVAYTHARTYSICCVVCGVCCVCCVMCVLYCGWTVLYIY